jgi:coenzyme PQQ precursor peptide PqqA
MLPFTGIYDNLDVTTDSVLKDFLEEHYMTWQKPEIEEIPCNCEINSYSNGDL